MSAKGGLAAIALVAATTGCTAYQVAEPECWRTAPSPSDYRVIEAGRAGTVNDQDRYFICHATINGEADLFFDEMAIAKARSADVRAFARRSATEGERVAQGLAVTSTSYAGVEQPDRLDVPHELAGQQLTALSGADFDRAYLHAQAQDAEALIQLYRQETLAGGEPRLQSFAARTLPALEQKLTLARSIEASGQSSATAPSANSH